MKPFSEYLKILSAEFFTYRPCYMMNILHGFSVRDMYVKNKEVGLFLPPYLRTLKH